MTALLAADASSPKEAAFHPFPIVQQPVNLASHSQTGMAWKIFGIADTRPPQLSREYLLNPTVSARQCYRSQAIPPADMDNYCRIESNTRD